MQKLQTLKLLEEELGEVLKSGMSGESLYYSASWDEVRRRAAGIARKHHLSDPNDVRVAGYALELLGIPNHYTEAGQDEKGDWIVYWR